MNNDYVDLHSHSTASDGTFAPADVVRLAKEAGLSGLALTDHAAILVRKGYVSSIKQAFDKYLATGGLAYFDKERLDPKQAIALIRQSGGLPVLAHPVQLRTKDDAELERIVKSLVDLGLAGLEV